MIGKFDEETMENQTKLNLSEFYTTEEIKLLKKSIPDINNIIYLVSNNDLNGTDGSKISKEQINHPYNRYYSSLKKNKNNSNISFFIEKEKFYPLILDKIKQYLEKEQNTLLIKSVSLIMNEILNLSKIIKQNLIYRNFFKSFKNTKLLEIKKSKKSYSHNREISKRSIKVNSAIINLKNNQNSSTNRYYTSNKMELRNKNTKSNTDVKKQLSFKTDKETKKNNKFQCEISLYSNNKSKEKTTKGNKVTKNISQDHVIPKGNQLNTFTSKNNKTSINLQRGNNNSNTQKKSRISMDNSNPTNITKKMNNYTSSGYNKISLKKSNKGTKNMDFDDIVNNKCECDLTNTHQNKKRIKKIKY